MITTQNSTPHLITILLTFNWPSGDLQNNKKSRKFGSSSSKFRRQRLNSYFRSTKSKHITPI